MRFLCLLHTHRVSFTFHLAVAMQKISVEENKHIFTHSTLKTTDVINVNIMVVVHERCKCCLCADMYTSISTYLYIYIFIRQMMKWEQKRQQETGTRNEHKHIAVGNIHSVCVFVWLCELSENNIHTREWRIHRNRRAYTILKCITKRDLFWKIQ